ncbi:class I SAM-dependent methyltransferase [Saccharibacillus brassicae]|uniref:Class I SAM-dependent methyltransferase n=1 Tax=Saccharibacillus brassicae TaxID=2583377 RepID=A0A4Y6USY2_SACBS|nr:class I SAM-dependent methyltransferase [Saccharibacillus brassicae]QDH20792.1 class I SAM-dependent methyltransferase [Saccharibacillus brassicae]
MKYTGERFIPDSDGLEIEAEHVHRYSIISKNLRDMKVLDAGCGTGYGSLLMSQYADSVVGIDISEESVEWCKQKYVAQKNLSFVLGSLEELPFADEEFDCIICLEVIEHVDQAIQKRFLEEAKRVLSKNGILIISTPNKLLYTDRSGYHNPYHIHEFYVEEYKEFLQREFMYLKMYNQSLYAVSSIFEEMHADHKVQLLKNADIDENGKYMIAICSNNEQAFSNLNLNSVYKYDNPAGLNIASLYVASDEQPYSPEHKETGVMVSYEDNKFSVTFDLTHHNNISKLRFDPIEDNFCICNIEKIQTDGITHDALPLNALQYYRQGFLFINIDPQFEVRGDFENATYITLNGYFKILSQVEVSEFVDVFYNKMIIAMKENQNEEEST